MQNGFLLAEFNMAPALYPLEDVRMAEFVANLDRINGLAEQSDGFVWRLVEANGAEAAKELFGDARLLINLSVWLSVETLFDYVYRSQHLDFWKRRQEWFAHDARPQTVMWWIPYDTRPTVVEAAERLERLRREGPSQDAFTFKARFPAP